MIATKIQYFAIIIPIFIHYMNKNNKLTLITSISIILNIISNFSVIHMLFLWIIGNIGFNMIYKEDKPKHMINIVENYLDQPQTINKYHEIIKLTEDKYYNLDKNIKKETYKKKENNSVCEKVTNLFKF